jgi:hypothetical protein
MWYLVASFCETVRNYYKMKEVKLYKSPWKALKLILLCSIFVVVGIWLLSTDTPRWIAWLNIGFFGLGYPVGFFHLLDRRPQIIINELGIFDRTTNQDTINWEIIKDAYLVDVHGQKFICLIVDENFEPSKKKGLPHRTMAGLNKTLGFQELNISLGQLKIDEQKLGQFIMAMSRADKPAREEIIKALPERMVS